MILIQGLRRLGRALGDGVKAFFIAVLAPDPSWAVQIEALTADVPPGAARDFEEPRAMATTEERLS
jgi:hypothetical protein